MNAQEKGKLLRMAGNIAAGLAAPYAERMLHDDWIKNVAKDSVEISEEIIRQVNEKVGIDLMKKGAGD